MRRARAFWAGLLCLTVGGLVSACQQRAGVSIACAGPPGLAEAAPHVVLLGHTAGSQEPYALATALACERAAGGGKVVLAFDLPGEDFQPVRSAVETGTRQAVRAALEAYWKDQGGSAAAAPSAALAEAVSQVHAMRSQGMDITVAGIALTASQRRALRAARSGQSGAEALMARTVSGLVDEGFGVVALVDAPSAGDAPLERPGAPVTPMGALLDEATTLNVMLAHEAGEAWVCARDACAARPVGGLAGLEGLETGAWRAEPYQHAGTRFDGVVNLGPLSASPPAFSLPARD